MTAYLRDPISNGNPNEQALIRRWWVEEQESKGLLIWEYYLEGKYADAIWVPDADEQGQEQPGKNTSSKYPLSGIEVVLCEAKLKLTPEVIGQALVYSEFAKEAGAVLRETIVFSEEGSAAMVRVCNKLGLGSVVKPIEEKCPGT